MLSLPICPYCHTVYSYKEVKIITKKEKEKCYNCNKTFGVSSKKGKWLLILIVVIILIIINTFVIFTSKSFNSISFYSMIFLDMAVLLLAFAFFPFTAKFYKLSKHKKL